jgi:hypothetical protein
MGKIRPFLLFNITTLGTLLFIIRPALADEQLTPIASGGTWLAIQHSDSITDPPDVCLAVDEQTHFAMRYDQNDIEFRLSNESWTLPANITGTLELDVNGSKYPLPVSFNTSTMISAIVSQDLLLSVIGDMQKTYSMAVIAGHAAPLPINLAGSAPVLNAFLTCADIPEPNNSGAGNNPFSTQATTPSAPNGPPETNSTQNTNGASALSPQPFNSAPAVAAQPPLSPAPTSYAQGHADRVRLENLVNSLPGPEKQGFVYWSSQRSLTNPGSCEAGAVAAFPNDSEDEASFVQGCQEGQVQLAPTDIRRKTDPMYKAGWNAPVTSPNPGN